MLVSLINILDLLFLVILGNLIFLELGTLHLIIPFGISIVFTPTAHPPLSGLWVGNSGDLPTLAAREGKVVVGSISNSPL